MAHEKNDISDIVKKCKILLLDIEGTTTSISFVKDKLFPYAEENVKDFLNDEWDTEDVKDAVKALRKLALEDEEKKVEGVVTIPGEDASKDDQIEGLVKSVKWQMSSDRKVGPLKQLQGLIWKKGYDKGDIKGHVYDDVSPALELWRAVEGQKVYIYSSGSVQAQKLLFGMTSAGDMLKLIDGHFDTAVGTKQAAESYTTIAEKIGCKAEDILFLTDIDKEAEAARSAGVQAALVSREGNAPLSEAVAASYPVLYSFAELAVTNKRKPDAQDEQPAKVLKTDVETDVKTAPETEVKEVPAQPVTDLSNEKSVEPEKMEVEDEAPAKETPAEKPTEVVEKVETIIEEITDSNDVADMPVCDVEPVIEESTEKTEQKETDKMETEVDTNSASKPKEFKNGDLSSSVPPREKPRMTTSLKGLVEMNTIQMIGEKDGEILTFKLGDVANMDRNAPKQLLNPIAEETMETENVDSNDIVERILDTELELEMKQCADIDINTVQEISKVKEGTEEDKSKKQDVAKNETATAVIPEEKPIEKIKEVSATKEESSPTEERVKENNTTEQKVNESCAIEHKVVENNEQKTDESTTEPKAEESKVSYEEKTKPEEEKVENKMETEISPTETDDINAKVEENKIEEKIDTEEKKVEAETSDKEKVPPIEKPAEASSMETEQSETPVETKEKDNIASDSPTEEVKPETDAKETQVNGKSTNGDAGDPEMANLNGVASKEDELSSRLSMENGKEAVNGANGDSNDADKPKSENNGEEIKKVADIKVKTVDVDEPRNDPIEQPTEA